MSTDPVILLTFISVVIGIIWLVWWIFDERNRLKIIVNKFEIIKDKDSRFNYFELDFDVSNISKKQNTIRDIQLKIPNKKISLNPDKIIDDPLPGIPGETIQVVDGVYRPIFDISPGITVNQKYTFNLETPLNLEGLDFELILSDTYNKKKRKRLRKPTEKIISI